MENLEHVEAMKAKKKWIKDVAPGGYERSPLEFEREAARATDSTRQKIINAQLANDSLPHKDPRDSSRMRPAITPPRAASENLTPRLLAKVTVTANEEDAQLGVSGGFGASNTIDCKVMEPLRVLHEVMQYYADPRDLTTLHAYLELFDGLRVLGTPDRNQVAKIVSEAIAILPSSTREFAAKTWPEQTAILQRQVDVEGDEPTVCVIFEWSVTAGIVGLRPSTQMNGNGISELTFDRPGLRELPWHLVLDKRNAGLAFASPDTRKFFFQHVLPKCTIYCDTFVQQVKLATQSDILGFEFLANMGALIIRREGLAQERRTGAGLKQRSFPSTDEVFMMASIYRASRKIESLRSPIYVPQGALGTRQRIVFLGLGSDGAAVRIFTMWQDEAKDDDSHWRIHTREIAEKEMVFLRYDYRLQGLRATDREAAALKDKDIRYHSARVLEQADELGGDIVETIVKTDEIDYSWSPITGYG